VTAPAHPAELESLLAAYPLPATWRIETCLVDSTAVQGLSVEIVGVAAKASDGREALGSAGERGRRPFARAFFELAERIAILEALSSSSAPRSVLGPARAPSEPASTWSFPEASATASYRYSRSNGVAAGADWNLARSAARAELIERDRILRSWYGLIAPERVPLPEDVALGALSAHYEFLAYAFPERPENAVSKASGGVGRGKAELEVVAVFGFPREPSVPLISGSGAGPTRAAAWDRALGECLQRWAFLWGESIPEREPEFSPSPDYHQELFLWPAMHQRLRAWLDGAHLGCFPALSLAALEPERIGYLDLTGELPCELCVVRAVSDEALPLVFGRGHPAFCGDLPATLAVHPLA
jgi:hypothetical protein